MTPTELAALAARFPAFASLAGENRALLAERAMMRRLPEGATYLREGEACAGIALVIEGLLRVGKTSVGGRTISLYEIGPGETCVLSASCLLTGSRYPAQVVVLEPVLAALIPGDVFARLFDTVPAVRRFVLDHFAERLATTMALVEEVAFRRVDQRAARWLAESGTDGGVTTMSHEEIAAHLGTARVVVSRILGDFEGRGWVRLGRRRVETVDREALRRYGNQSD